MKAMGTPRAAIVGSALALLSAGAACEPVPPDVPQNASDVPPPARPPAPAAPAAASAGVAAPGEGDAQYASAEYAVGENADAYDDNDPAALKDFRPALDPYGSWVDDRTYGTVWVPSESAVGQDFTPYSTAGHWVYDDDWVWVSEYPWGWAPFHYGRWILIEGRGWSWVPGRVYRGAWVTWGVDDGNTYLGWAPMGPDFVWFGGYSVAWTVYVGPRWVYCPRGEVFSPRVGARVVAGAAAAPVAARMRPYVSASPTVAGPSPQRLGLAPSQVPHGAGPNAQSVARAQAFARPSTAAPVGGSTATRVQAPSARPVTGSAASPYAVPGSRAPVPAYSGARSLPSQGTVARPEVVPYRGPVAPAPPPVGAGVRPPATPTPTPRTPPAEQPVRVAPRSYAPPPAAGRSVAPSAGGGHHR
jgi:hypothetical protein